jgi:hypothetical protein
MDTAEMVMGRYVDALTEADIEFGKMLRESLRSNPAFPVNGMLWLSQSDSGPWHLVIATPKIDAVGPKNAYAELADVARSSALDTSQLFRVELISPRDPLYQALRSVFGQTGSVDGVRLGNTQIGGMYIEDAYLYEIR